MNKMLLILLFFCLLSVYIVSASYPQNLCYRLSNGTPCFNGTSGQIVLLNAKINWSDILNPQSSSGSLSNSTFQCNSTDKLKNVSMVSGIITGVCDADSTGGVDTWNTTQEMQTAVGLTTIAQNISNLNVTVAALFSWNGTSRDNINNLITWNNTIYNGKGSIGNCSAGYKMQNITPSSIQCSLDINTWNTTQDMQSAVFFTDINANISALRTWNNSLQSRITNLETWNNSLVSWNATSRDNINNLLSWNTSKLSATANTCSAGNYSRFNGSGFECFPDVGIGGGDGNNYPTQLNASGTSTKYLQLNISGLSSLSASWTDLDTWNTSSQMVSAINNSGYYNIKVDWSNLVGNNVTSYYLASNPNGYISGYVDTNTWNTTQDMQSAVFFTDINANISALRTWNNSIQGRVSNLETWNSTLYYGKGGVGNCTGSQVVQNITPLGVQCVTPPGGTDTWNTTQEMQTAVFFTDINANISALRTWNNSLQSRITNLETWNNSLVSWNATSRDNINNLLSWNTSKLSATANTCSAGNYSRFNGSGFECFPDVGIGGGDGNNYPTQLNASGTSTKYLQLNISGLSSLSASWTDLDTWNTSSQMVSAINNSGYYNIKVDWSNLVGNNVTSYYLASNPNGYISGYVDTNTWNTTQDMQSAVFFTDINANISALRTWNNSIQGRVSNLETWNSTLYYGKGGVGNCTGSQVVQNITPLGVQCVTPPGGTDTWNTTQEMQTAVGLTTIAQNISNLNVTVAALFSWNGTSRDNINNLLSWNTSSRDNINNLLTWNGTQATDITSLKTWNNSLVSWNGTIAINVNNLISWNQSLVTWNNTLRDNVNNLLSWNTTSRDNINNLLSWNTTIKGNINNLLSWNDSSEANINNLITWNQSNWVAVGVANTTANNALPKSGGTITGNVTLDNANITYTAPTCTMMTGGRICSNMTNIWIINN